MTRRRHLAGCVLGFVLLVGVFRPAFAPPAGGPLRRMVRDDVEYLLYGFEGSRTLPEGELLRFHSLFVESAKDVFAREGLKRPLRFQVALAGDGAVFQEISGMPRYVAGLFLRERNLYLFMNPHSLRRANLLESAVRHELCHGTLHLRRSPVREGSSLPGTREQYDILVERMLWMEESYCEAGYPVSTAEGGGGEFTYPADWDLFRTRLDTLLGNSSGARRRGGYLAARLWGEFLLKHWGRESFLRYLSLEGGEQALPELYRTFLAERRRR